MSDDDRDLLPMPPAVHLHQDDHPQTLRLLAAVLGVGQRRNNDLADLGYVSTGYGAALDWDRLVAADRLSSTERAVLQIARGCAVLEFHGGHIPAAMAATLVDVVRAVA